MAAGQANHSDMKSLTNKANLERAVLSVSDSGYSLLHLISGAPWRNENQSGNGNQSDTCTEGDTVDSDCRVFVSTGNLCKVRIHAYYPHYNDISLFSSAILSNSL